jgi:NAD(P)-dependent dehydrogenase (short-subunit alcohol dehydrogenase family)
VGQGVRGEFQGIFSVLSDVRTKYDRQWCYRLDCNIINPDGRSGKEMSGVYASSNASVIMFTKTLAKCLAPMGIRVNCVSPGIVATAIYNKVEAEMMMEQGTFADWLVEGSIKNGQLLIPCG